MLRFLIRYIVITFCINYTYHKLLNTKNYKRINILLILIPIIISGIFFTVSSTYSYLVPILHICLLLFLFLFTGAETPETTFTTLILAYCISYICYFFSIIITFLPFTFIFSHIIKDNLLWTNVSQIVISFVQYLLCLFIFSSKRLRTGIPYIRNPFISHLGVFTGMLLVACIMHLYTIDDSQNINTHLPYIASFFAFFILSILIYFWWKNISHQAYLLQAKERECSRLKEQLAYYEENLKSTETEKEELSKLIHRDNKLISSLQLAVHELLTEVCNEETTTLSQTANRLLIQLNEEMEERKGLLTHLSQDKKKLPDTGVPSFNQLLSYIQRRCMEHSVVFDCSVLDNMPFVLEDIYCPSEKELSTLLADMLENALISTVHNKGERIFLLMEKEQEDFRIEIWDSGDKFSKDVLYYIGKKRFTTHKSEGGSGIGLMVTWELLKKYQASIIIDEENSPDNFFTKKVIIRFDRKNNYILCSQRSKEDMALLKQRQDLQIKEKF